MWSNVSFLLVRSVVGVLRLGPSADVKDSEIAVFRYQLSILQRQVRHPRYNHADRTVLSALSRLLPRSRWDA